MELTNQLLRGAIYIMVAALALRALLTIPDDVPRHMIRPLLRRYVSVLAVGVFGTASLGFRVAQEAGVLAILNGTVVSWCVGYVCIRHLRATGWPRRGRD